MKNWIFKLMITGVLIPSKMLGSQHLVLNQYLTMNPKPLWIKIISDNGGHYHNSELMAIISHWYDWYNIEVCGWIFLEPGEAKTTVDSHYATVNKFYYK